MAEKNSLWVVDLCRLENGELFVGTLFEVHQVNQAFCVCGTVGKDLNHYQKKNWPVQVELVLSRSVTVKNFRINRDSIFFPSLHIRLGLVKQLTKSLNRNGECFTYFFLCFTRIDHWEVVNCYFRWYPYPQVHPRSIVQNFMQQIEMWNWPGKLLFWW